MIINRHKIPLSKLGSTEFINTYPERLGEYLNRLNIGRNIYLLQLSSRFKSMALCGILKDTDERFLYTGMRYSAEVGIAQLTSFFCRKGSKSNVEIGNKIYTLNNVMDDNILDYEFWTRIFEFSSLLDIRESLQNKLCNLQIGNAKDYVEEYHFNIARYLKAIHQQKEEERLLIFKILQNYNFGIYYKVEGVEKEINSHATIHFRRILFPIIQLYELIIEGKEKQFNSLLRDFIFDKKNWIIEKEYDYNINFSIDFSLLAVCSFARKSNINVFVKSDYIPEYIYLGNFKNELIDLSVYGITRYDGELEKIDVIEERVYPKYWNKIPFQHFIINIPNTWRIEDRKGDRFKAGQGAEIKLSTVVYKSHSQNSLKLKKSLSSYCETYEENGFTPCSEIIKSNNYYYQYLAFETDPIMLIAGMEKEYKGEKFLLYFVFTANNCQSLQKHSVIVKYMLDTIKMR